jgi:hypothetical protein
MRVHAITPPPFPVPLTTPPTTTRSLFPISVAMIAGLEAIGFD